MLAAAASAALADESDLAIEVGVAYDDNPFETPSEPYFDQFDLVVVDPVASPGFFIPFALAGDYRAGNENHRFVLDYRLRHHAYGEDNRNADETYSRVAPGYQLVTARNGRRENLFFVVPYATYNKEIYFDRDTGLGQVISLEDASNRYRYFAAGGEGGFSSRVNRSVKWEVAARYERRDYEDVQSVSSLDHDRMQLRGDLEFDLGRRLDLSFDYTYRVLEYEERPSRDLDGGITAGQTAVEYSYHIAGATLRVRPSSRWNLYFDLEYMGRTDEFVGYNDYDMLGGRVRALWTSGPSRVRFALRYRQRDYPRAFIFDMDVNPATGLINPNKAYDIFDATVRYERPGLWRSNLFAELDLELQNAADPRFSYDRLRISAGLEWVFGSTSR